jgi:hypothetical protein
MVNSGVKGLMKLYTRPLLPYSAHTNKQWLYFFFVGLKLSSRQRGKVSSNRRSMGTNKQSITYKLETQLRHPSKHDIAIRRDGTSTGDLLCHLRCISHFSRAQYGRCVWPYHIFRLQILIFRICASLWCWSRWSRRRRHRSAAWMFLSCEWCALFRYIQASARAQSFVQRSPTERVRVVKCDQVQQ